VLRQIRLGHKLVMLAATFAMFGFAGCGSATLTPDGGASGGSGGSAGGHAGAGGAAGAGGKGTGGAGTGTGGAGAGGTGTGGIAGHAGTGGSATGGTAGHGAGGAAGHGNVNPDGGSPDGTVVACVPGASGCPCETGGVCQSGLACHGGACKPIVCGDGVVDEGERCDDGNTVDTDACRNNCTPAACGDGVVQAGVEECDDGNTSNTDACTTQCKRARCGDGFVQSGEECDTGATDNTGPCLSTCKLAKCGDGFVEAGVETCDDGNTVNTDACSNSCKSAKCGDGIVQTGEACDDGNTSNTDACLSDCTLPRCGDGFVQAGVEQCDDGNTSNTDACTNACKTATCGDGFVQAGVEQCDDGNTSNTDACTNSCKTAKCGDGFVQAGVEQCDDGNTSNADSCNNSCKTAKCGDGFVQGTEECDDGNGNDGDSCTNACKKRYNVAFVSSTTYTISTLGGALGADAACQARAQAAGLGGTYVAWISDSTSGTIASRLGNARGWVRPDGKPFMDSYSPGYSFYPPELNEAGTAVGKSPLVAAGSASNTGYCSDWKSSSNSDAFGAGDPTGGWGAWQGLAVGLSCGGTFRIYCLGKDFSSPLTFTKATGRLAFASSSSFYPGGGLAAADAQCQADAAAAALPGTYRAMLATSTASLASRFSTTGAPWVRLDGIPLVAAAADMFAANGRLVAALDLTASGSFLLNYGGWSGSTSPQAAGTLATTCSDWTTTSGNGIGGRTQYTDFAGMQSFDNPLACTNIYTHLYCLQQ
jgi:cysteine-rich repeat protein